MMKIKDYSKIFKFKKDLLNLLNKYNYKISGSGYDDGAINIEDDINNTYYILSDDFSKLYDHDYNLLVEPDKKDGKNHMKIIIFGNTIKQANEKFDELISKINCVFYETLVKSRDQCRIVFYNRAEYITAYAGDNARGHRCDKVYVPIDVNHEILNYVIRPILINSIIPEDEQIVYY